MDEKLFNCEIQIPIFLVSDLLRQTVITESEPARLTSLTQHMEKDSKDQWWRGSGPPGDRRATPR